MRRFIRLFFVGVALLLVASHHAIAQRAVAKSGLNIRSGQSTSSKVLGHLSAGDNLTLLSPSPRKSYLHVETAGGTKGWAWSARLDVLSGTSTPVTAGRSDRGTRGAATTGGTATTTTTSTTIDPSWPKVPSNAAPFTWPDAPHTVCPAVGDGADTVTNRWKNRNDSVASYHEVPWSAIATLDFPHNRIKHRTDWHSAADRAALARFEGIPMRVVGFLSGIKVEVPSKKNGVVGKGESTNCGENTRSRVDQMWQYLSPADTTGIKARITLWEIHPVTRIEVWRGGSWVLLEGIP